MKNIILFMVLLVISKVVAASNIVVVLNEGKIGDQNQLNGVITDIHTKYPVLSIQYISNNEIKLLEEILDEACHTNKKTALLTSGEDGIKVIKAVSGKICSNIVILNSAHMIFKEHTSILGKANIIALPKHSVDKQFLQLAMEKKTEIIQTVGVAHNLTTKMIKQEYEKHAKEFKWLEGKDQIAMVVLGGDAPTSDGIMKFYTVEEGIRAADYIGNFCKKENYSLMIFNGPRTGQYDPKTSNKNELVHKDEQLDLVTKAFIERLAKYLQPSQFKLYNFSHTTPSPYKAGFWVVKNAKKGKCFLPGESTSMISEGNDNLAGNTIIINNGAMNEIHLKHVNSEVNAGRAIALDQNFKEILLDKAHPISSNKTATSIIADALLERLR